MSKITRQNREDGARELVDFDAAVTCVASHNDMPTAEVADLFRRGVRMGTSFAYYRLEPLSCEIMDVVESIGLFVGISRETPQYPISISGRGMMKGFRLFADEDEVRIWLEEEWSEFDEVKALRGAS